MFNNNKIINESIEYPWFFNNQNLITELDNFKMASIVVRTNVSVFQKTLTQSITFV